MRGRGVRSQAVGPVCLPAVKPHVRARPKTWTRGLGEGALKRWDLHVFPAVKPSGRAKPKTGTPSNGCCRGVLGTWARGVSTQGKPLLSRNWGYRTIRVGI